VRLIIVFFRHLGVECIYLAVFAVFVDKLFL